MIMYKVTKTDIFTRECYRVRGKSVYYSFKDLASGEIRCRRELIRHTRHIWVKSEEEAKLLLRQKFIR